MSKFNHRTPALHSTDAYACFDPQGYMAGAEQQVWVDAAMAGSTALATIMAVEHLDGMFELATPAIPLDAALFVELTLAYDTMPPIYYVECPNAECGYYIYPKGIVVMVSSGMPYPFQLAA